jgi:hypothetical protein
LSPESKIDQAWTDERGTKKMHYVYRTEGTGILSINSKNIMKEGEYNMKFLRATVRIAKRSVHNGPFETPGSKFFTIKDPNGVSIQFFQQK